MAATRRSRAALVTVLVTSGYLVTCGCAASETPTPLIAGSGAPVVVPGAPGEQGRTATPGEKLGDSEARTGAGDVRFAEAMIPHHQQALAMAALVAARTPNQKLRALSERITAGQTPEITVMTRWLSALGRSPAHDHVPGAYGMASEAEMNQLRGARGTAFDALFLRLMIRHHQGAVTMAGQELRDGTDRIMRTMAQEVVSGQQIEITRMQALL
ncbi:DUF305 domain-containing protein [Streptosporangiaceae bacterium NEAU-GS5]|nr:DUF305 domain-containing protein [Streptosporangiaceae bacterium NEAU-GS5]